MLPRQAVAASHRLLGVSCCGNRACLRNHRMLNGDVPSCAPGRILGHEGAGVTRRLRSGRIPAAVSGTSKRPAPITEKGLIPNLFQMFHMFLWGFAPGQAPLAAAWRLNWS
jgi:hypothetical protein